MAHTTTIYICFDFGTDEEEKVQQARHKLDAWRQAFRLDKRVQYKMDRPESTTTEAAARPAPAGKPVAAAKAKEKPAAKGASKSSEPASAKPEATPNGKVGLLVRLYFSSNEKLSEQRWLERIPSEEPFKSAAPKVIHPRDPEFEATDQQYESLTG